MSSFHSFARAAQPRSLAVASRVTLGALSLALLAAVGCGEAKPDRVAVFPVKGSITFKGQPMPGAFVTLHPKTPVADVPAPRASVGNDGTFNLTTFAGGDGAPAGQYVVTVLWYKPVQKGADVVAGPNVVPPKYTHETTSDLIVEVASQPNTLKPIQL